MQGFELIKAAMLLRKTERLPWVPFVGVHGWQLIGVDAKSYLTSTDLLVKGITRAVEMCAGMLEKVKQAITELAKELNVTIVTYREQMASFGIVKGPALVTVNYKLKSENNDNYDNNDNQNYFH